MPFFLILSFHKKIIKKTSHIAYVSTSKRVFLLATVYLFLLTSFMLPHHHHEEVVCYTSTHCDTEGDNHNNDIQDHADHSHDHTSGETSQHCLSLEFYVKSNFNKSNKKPISLRLINCASSNFSPLFSNHQFQDDFRTKEKLFEFIGEHNIYSVFVKRQLPLRGPPFFIA